METTEVEKLAQLAEKQKTCAHRVIQPYENEDEDVQVCQECKYVAHRSRFKEKPGRVFLPTIEGFSGYEDWH